MKQISDIDLKHFKLIRDNIDSIILNASRMYDVESITVLDVAPQTHEGAKKYFKKASVKTLDLDKNSNADYICDLAKADQIMNDTFDVIFCTEVLEHTDDPFSCAKTMFRILKPTGVCFVTTPFNFRIHNPLPDNWRFTEHGLRLLFKDFNRLQINALEDGGRFLMPIQYSVVAQK